MRFFENRPLCAACAIFIVSTAVLSVVSSVAKFIVLAVAAAAAVLLFIFERKFSVKFVFVGALILSCIVSVIYYNVIVSSQTDRIGSEGDMTAVVRRVTYSSPYASYADIRVTDFNGENVGFNAKYVSESSAEFEEGEIITFFGIIEPIPDGNDGFDTKGYYNSKGCYVEVRSSSDVIRTGERSNDLISLFTRVNLFCGSRLSMNLNENAYGLASAVFLGDKTELPPSLKRDFRELGLSHMLAVSGMHLSILIGGIYYLLRFFGMGKKSRTVVTIVICVFYMCFTGAPPSILRSGLMFIIMGISALTGRINDSPTSLFLSGALILLFSPNTVFDVGFLLSFFATFGILAVLPFTEKLRIRAAGRNASVKVLTGLLSPVLITLGAVAFTLPITALCFDRFYVLSPITNLIFSPLISCVLIFSPFAVVFSYVPLVGEFFGFLINKIFSLIKVLTSFGVSLEAGSLCLGYPYVKYLIAVLCAGIVLLMFLRIKNELWYLCPFACFLCAYFIGRSVFMGGFDSYSYLMFINEGKNDAICAYDGDCILIDFSAGSFSFMSRSADAAESRFYSSRIDTYVITHYHNAMISSFDRITDEYYIKNAAFPNPASEEERYVFECLCEICEEKNIDHSVSDLSGCVSLEGTEIRLSEKKISRSTHPVVSALISAGDYSLDYFGSSYNDVSDYDGLYDIVAFGSHGPKQKSDTKIPSASFVVFMGDDDPPPAECNSIIVDDSRATIRIEK